MQTPEPSEAARQNEQQMRAFIEHLAQMCAHPDCPYPYRSYYDFIARHGIYVPYRPLPVGVVRGTIKMCFQNSAAAALWKRSLYLYMEGMAFNGILPIHHAWNLDREGYVVDRTWSAETIDCMSGLGAPLYFGVPFRTAYLKSEYKRGDFFGLLDTWKSHYPLLTGRIPVVDAIYTPEELRETLYWTENPHAF